MVKAIRIISLVSAFVLFSSSGSTEVHPLKMSFSKLEISSEGVVDLKTRIFLDDITEQLESLYGLDTVDFSAVETEATQTLQRYLTEHFFFEQSGKKSTLRINGVSFSQNRLAVEVHMSTENPLDVSKQLFLTNTLLCDADPKQKNDVIYREHRLRLSATNPKAQIQFK
ncbi:MAG: hypothetical protein KDB98_10030 [Flavobacteriales bacterium]|nr:hypothetical protein [Flavobacteriales bacterium]